VPGGGWVPVPDPPALTTAAVERATALCRRELTSLRELLEARIALSDTRREDLRALLDERHAAQLRAFEAARVTALDSVQAALEATREAVGKAEAATEKRFDGVNEFRQTLADQNATFLTRTQYDTAHESLSGRVDLNNDRIAAIELRLTSRLDLVTGQDAGASAAVSERRLSQNTMISILAALIIGVGVIVSVLTYAHR
jgi:hypothetical protein